MIIRDISTYIIPAGWKEWIFVVIETDEGVTGVGEATIEWRPRAVEAAIRECRDMLIGKDPKTIALHWLNMYKGFQFRGGTLAMSAISAIDQALWDIAGKAAGMPVADLLGGPISTEVRVYLNQWYRGAKTNEDYGQKARDAVATGATGLKFYPLRAATARTPPGPEQPTYHLTTAELNRALSEIAAVRDAVGPNIELMIDLQGRLDLNSAIQLCREVEPFKLMFVEEPFAPENNGLYKKLSDATSVRIATGERLSSRWEFRELIEQQAVGFVQPGVTHAGGISEMRRIAEAADTYMMGFAPHCPHGPVAVAAHVQLCSTLPNFVMLEAYPNDAQLMRNEIMEQDILIKGDSITLPDRPGLGIEVNMDALKRLAIDPNGRQADRVSAV